MMRRITSKLSYANVMATVAVFMALGGVSWAAVHLPRNSVGSAQLRANAVTNAKIRNAQVSVSKLRANSVSTVKIINRAVTAAKIADGAVGSTQLANDAVSTPKIADGVVSTSKIATTTLNSLRLSCITGTILYAGSCFETTARPAATFAVASKTCGDAGGRLGTWSELEGLRQQPGIAIGNNVDYELTSNIYETDLLADVWLGIDQGGNRTQFLFATPKQFRCAFPRTQTG